MTISDTAFSATSRTSLEELKKAVAEEDYQSAIALCESFLASSHSAGKTTGTRTDVNSSVDNAASHLPAPAEESQLAIVYEIYVKCLLHSQEYAQVAGLKPPSKACQRAARSLQAYALYRLDEFERCLSCVNQGKATNAHQSTQIDGLSSAGTLEHHLQAQVLYRTNETQKALEKYAESLAVFEGYPDTEEELELLMEIYTNAIAVFWAKGTPYHTPAPASPNLPHIPEQALKFYRAHSVRAHQQHPMDYPTSDLACNLAGFAFLSASTTATRQAALLILREAARVERLAVVDDPSADDDDDDIAVQRNLYSLRMTALWGQTLWGQKTLPVILSSSSDDLITEADRILEQVNSVLIHAASQSRKNIDRTLQLLGLLLAPHQPGNRDFKLTALQTRLCWYNQAVLQLQTQRYLDCRQSLARLGRSLGLDRVKKNTTGSGSVIPTPSGMDTTWWQIRMEVLSAYTYCSTIKDDDDDDIDFGDNGEEADGAGKTNKNNAVQQQEGLQVGIQKLKNLKDQVLMMSDRNDDGVGETLRDRALVYLDLHLQQLQDGGRSTPDQNFRWLQKQQQTDGGFLAVTASLAKRYQDQDQAKKANELFSSGCANNSTVSAEMATRQLHYSEAVSLYRKASNSTDSTNEALQAKMLKALSYVDPKRALREWDEMAAVDNGCDDTFDENDGGALERRPLPRIKYHSTRNATSPGSIGVDSSISTTSRLVQSTAESKKRDQQSVLRRRCKQRHVYLSALQQKGVFSYSRPVQPDPERWTSKHERQRRRRWGGKQSKASQGGISSKDADKLDVMARANGTVSTAPSSRSTAHMSVAGGGRKGSGKRR